MSVPEQVPYKEYRATGSNKSFEITFYLPDPKDLVVMVNKEIPLVGAYSIVGDSVVFSAPPNEGDLVELTRDTQLDRETNFKSYDNSFRPETINFDLDKIWLVLQESNLVDAKILARLKQEIEWRRTHDFNYDELAQVREKQLFDALKGYTDTLNAATNPGVFQGVIAGVVFAQDGKSIQTHLEEILEALAQERENIDSKADQTYVEEQLGLKANQKTTYNKTEVDSVLSLKAPQETTYTKNEVDTALSAVAAGHKAYTTLALAQAAQETLPVNTIVEVTNDPTASNNGTYQWNGTTLTKSPYDPLSQAKADATTKANAAEANAKAYALTNTNTSIDKFLGDSSGVKSIDGAEYFSLSPDRVGGVFTKFSKLTNARTYLIAIEPNIKYTVEKTQETQHYIILEHSFIPIVNTEGFVIRMINDSPNSGVVNGVVQFTTSENARWISVTTATTSATPANLKITKQGYIGPLFEKSKNLLNPIYRGVPVSLLYINATTNPFSSGLSVLRSVIVEVKPNTQYTFSLRSATSRFKVVLINREPDGAQSYINVLDQNGATSVTFTTGSRSVYLAVYYSNISEDPLMQLETGDQGTSYEKFGYTLKGGQAPSASGGFPLAVIDKQYDVTAQLKSAFAQSENATVFLSPGTYEFNQTLNIPSNARIIGLGPVTLKLTSTDLLETVVWRGTIVKTYLKSGIASENSYLENIKVVGAGIVDTSFLHFGICMQGYNHKLVEVSTDHINWEVTDAAERRQGGNGWGLVFFNAKRGKVYGGNFTYGGYENIGTENADDIVFDNVFCGIGWRTSFQVHKNSKNIKLINSTVEQRRMGTQTHSGVTFHGQATELVEGVTVNNCLIDAEVHDTWADRGGIQAVLGNEHNVTITNNTIKTNNWGIIGGVDGPSINPCQDWIVSGNRITADEKSVKIRGKNAIVNGNIIKAKANVEFIGDDATTCVEVNNTFVPVS